MSSKKTLLIVVAAAAIAAVGVFFALQQAAPTQSVSAFQPGDAGLVNGNLITAYNQAGDPDVFVIKEVYPTATKRVFQNEAIGRMYGQFGYAGIFTPGVIKQVSASTRDAFTLGCYVRNAETNDPKVYYRNSTGPDTATLHWVNVTAAEANAADSMFFPKTFDINNAEFNFYAQGAAYTSMSQIPACTTGGSATPVPVPGAVSASLSPANPASATVTGGASGVEMLRVRLTGTGTLSTVTFKRIGAGSANDFSNVYIYDGATRLTSGKSVSTSTGETTFISLNIAVNGSKDLSLVADIAAGQTAGNVNGFQIASMGLVAGTVTGLPISGNLFTMAGADSGILDVAKVGSIPNPVVGQKGAQLSEFRLTSNTEGSWVKRVTLLQGGTVKASDITNVKIKTGTTEWSGTVTSTGYLVFDMGSGFFIAKGGDAIFKVYGDMAGKKDEDVNLYFEYASDLWAVGDQFGFGMNTASGTANKGIDALDAASEAHDVTLQGGALTIAFNGPSAGNIGTNTSDTTLLRVSMTAVSNIEIRKTELTLCKDPAGDGSFGNAADTDSGWSDITDIKMTDEAAGGLGTVLGPEDGSAFTTSDSGTCEDSVTGAQKSFNNSFVLMGGKTYSFKVTGDINTANTDGNGVALSAADAMQLFLDNYADDTPDVTIMKYDGTNTAVADADIVPQSDIGGGIQTLQASSLTLGLSSGVNDQSFVRGTQGITAVGLTFKSAQASDMTVTDLVLTGYFSEAGSTFVVGSDTTTSVADLVSGVSLYEIESNTTIATTPTSNQLSNTTGTVTFNGLNWKIPAGATKTLGVKVNLGSNALADTDYFAFDINATTDVTALDKDSRTVNAGNADPNNSTSATTVVTVLNSGSLAVAVATATTPRDHAVYWGQTGDSAGVWRFTSTNEAQYLKTLQFGEYDAGGTQETDLATNARTVYLEYKNKLGQTLTASGALSTAGTTSFGFSDDATSPYVPKDSSMDVTIKVDYKNKTEGASTGKTWDFDFIPNTSSGTSMFKAIGEGSGVVIDGQDTGFTAAVDQDTAGTDIIIYRVFPEFKLITPTTTNLSVVDPIVSFTVTAKGLSDSRVFFDGTAAGSGSIKFAVLASGRGITADPNFTVRKGDGVVVDTGSITDAPFAIAGQRASMTIDFGTLDVEITGGTTQTFHVYLDSVSDFNTPAQSNPAVAADYFQVQLRDDENSLVNWVDSSTNSSNDLDTQSTSGYLMYLPMSGYQFIAQ